MMKYVKALVLIIIFVLFLPALIFGQTSQSSRLNVQIITDEADAVLSILAKKELDQEITESDWQKVFSSEGYVRLKRRELSMSRPFEDATFHDFVLSDDIFKKKDGLAETLFKWKGIDVNQVAARSFAYLPKTARISAKIYPVIKPKPNNFVFEQSAIFLYINPGDSREQFENTLAHELHHIGYGSGCASQKQQDEIKKLPPNIQHALTWLGAFGEGFAALAAAGGPDADPYADESVELRTNWAKDILDYNNLRKTVENFFIEVVDGKLSEKDANKAGFTFFGVQGRSGQWYTVGWQMGIVIEKTFGRDKLIEVICDRRKLLSTYNKAVKKYNRRNSKKLDPWSKELVKKIG
jgi:hypothetical protein